MFSSIAFTTLFTLAFSNPIRKSFVINTPDNKIHVNVNVVKKNEDVKNIKCKGSVKYNIQHEMFWSRQRHPDNYHDNAHWSSLFTVKHSSDQVIWKKGELSTPGVQEIAENGRNNILESELNNRNIQYNVGNGLPNSGSGLQKTNLTFDRDNSNISTVSMLAPSPDWFVGVSGLDLCDGTTGEWKNNVEVNLFPHDTGTDAGTRFDSGDQVSRPKENISRLNRFKNSVGKFKATLISNNNNNNNTGNSFKCADGCNCFSNCNSNGNCCAAKCGDGQGKCNCDSDCSQYGNCCPECQGTEFKC